MSTRLLKLCELNLGADRKATVLKSLRDISIAVGLLGSGAFLFLLPYRSPHDIDPDGRDPQALLHWVEIIGGILLAFAGGLFTVMVIEKTGARNWAKNRINSLRPRIANALSLKLHLPLIFVLATSAIYFISQTGTRPQKLRSALSLGSLITLGTIILAVALRAVKRALTSFLSNPKTRISREKVIQNVVSIVAFVGLAMIFRSAIREKNSDGNGASFKAGENVRNAYVTSHVTPLLKSLIPLTKGVSNTVTQPSISYPYFKCDVWTSGDRSPIVEYRESSQKECTWNWNPSSIDVKGVRSIIYVEHDLVSTKTYSYKGAGDISFPVSSYQLRVWVFDINLNRITAQTIIEPVPLPPGAKVVRGGDPVHAVIEDIEREQNRSLAAWTGRLRH